MNAEKVGAIPSHKSPPDDGIVYFQIDHQPFRVEVGWYTGADIREAITDPPVTADYDLWRLVPGEADVKVEADTRMPFSHSGLRFFTTPRFITGG